MVRGKVRRLTRDVLLVALVCLASTLASHDASAASNGHERYLVLGTIENIDSAANTITIRQSSCAYDGLSVTDAEAATFRKWKCSQHT